MTTMLPLPSASGWIKKPLLHFATVADILDKPAYEIRAMLEDGRLAFAIDVATRSTGRREIRILTQSLLDYLAGQTRPAVDAETELQQALRLILPAPSLRKGIATIRAATVYRRFAIHPSHLFELMGEGFLIRAPGTRCSVGPNGSPAILYSSVTEFIRQRRILS